MAYFDADVWQAVAWWVDWKTFGEFPFEGGPRDQPGPVYDAIRAAESEFQTVLTERRKGGDGDGEKG